MENLENTAKNTIYAVRYNMSFTTPVFTEPLNIERTYAWRNITPYLIKFI